MINVLYEDDHIIVVLKKEGIPTQSGKVTEKDMISELNNHIMKSARAKNAMADLKSSGKKDSVYLIHRLDKPVRGILVFAKNSDAAANLNTQMQNDEFSKKYYALVEGCPAEKEGILENYMYKNSDNIAEICNIQHTNAKLPKDVKFAKLEYRVTSTDNITSVLDIKLYTGRFHQIRCQLSNIGCPIAGDSMYGSALKLKNRKAIGLVAYSLEFKHPVSKEKMSFTLSQQEVSSCLSL